jgi:hypothetical protein
MPVFVFYQRKGVGGLQYLLSKSTMRILAAATFLLQHWRPPRDFSRRKGAVAWRGPVHFQSIIYVRKIKFQIPV